jgi:hypothetical protein
MGVLAEQIAATLLAPTHPPAKRARSGKTRDTKSKHKVPRTKVLLDYRDKVYAVEET